MHDDNSSGELPQLGDTSRSLPLGALEPFEVANHPLHSLDQRIHWPVALGSGFGEAPGARDHPSGGSRQVRFGRGLLVHREPLGLSVPGRLPDVFGVAVRPC